MPVKKKNVDIIKNVHNPFLIFKIKSKKTFGNYQKKQKDFEESADIRHERII